MSEALIGVVIGGLIASIAPVVSLLTASRRWKLEKKLEHLRAERARFEKLSSEMLPQLAEAMAKNSYPSPMMSDILVLMPKPVGDRFEIWMAEKDKDELKGKFAFMGICVEMKKALSDIDRKIGELIDA